jgi:phosphoserine phosphatase
MSIRRAPLQDLLERCDRLARDGTRLRPGQPQLAAFDADGTLWKADVGELLWDRLVAERALDRRATAPMARALRACGMEPGRDPYMDYPKLMELYRAGRCAEETMARVMLEGLAGLREEDVYVHALKAVTGSAGVSAALGGEAAELMDHLRRLGFHVVVVSGSPKWVVEVAVQPLGVQAADVLAGQVAVVNSVLTDGIIDPLPHGKGKIQAILRRFGRVPLVAAGNGLGDLAMLEGASHLRFLFNPTEELLRAADEMRSVTWSLTRQAGARAAMNAPAQAPPRTSRRTARPQP